MEEPHTYESAIEILEGIVRKLESDSTSLDDSLSLFEQGVKLSRQCASRLDEAEKKVLLLTEKADGSLSTSPLEVPET